MAYQWSFYFVSLTVILLIRSMTSLEIVRLALNNKNVGHPLSSSNSRTVVSWLPYYVIVTMPGQRAVPTTCTFKLLLQLV